MVLVVMLLQCSGVSGDVKNSIGVSGDVVVLVVMQHHISDVTLM